MAQHTWQAALNFLHRYSWTITLFLCLFLGLSPANVNATNHITDQAGQQELSVQPISMLLEDQFMARVAYASSVNEYLVVWEDDVHPPDTDTYAIRVDAQGNPIGSEIYIGISADIDTHPEVVYNPMMDEYLVVWENEYTPTDHDIFARLVGVDGSLIGGEIHVTYSTDYDSKPAVAINPTLGGYLVVFERLMNPGEMQYLSTMAVLLDAYGIPIPGVITIANTLLDNQAPAVACDGLNYLVAWQGDYGVETNIYGQRVEYDGALLGGQIGIATWEGDQLVPRLAYNNDDGQYLVVWEDHHFSTWGIYGYRLDQNGNLVGSQVSVAVSISNNQTDPDVAYDTLARSYLATWQYEYSLYDHDIYARRVAYDGSQPEPAYGISTTGYEEMHPAVAANSAQHALIVWEDARNLGSSGWDIYGSLETINMPVLSGAVYDGNPGDYSNPLPGVTVKLGCSSGLGYFGDLVWQTTTNANGQYFLPAYTLCEYYNIVESDPAGYYSIAAQSSGGAIYSSNWIYYTYPLTGKVLSDNLFFDLVLPPIDDTPPGNWTNFQPTGWVNVQSVSVSEQVEDTYSGLDIDSAQYQFSTDGGGSWSPWLPATITGYDGITTPQTISAVVPFARDSGPDSQNLVQFSVADIAGNRGFSAQHQVKVDTVLPTNPNSIFSPSHTPNVWSNNQYITVEWSGATDDRSGIYGYSTSFDQNPDTIPDIYRDTADPSTVNYAYTDSGSWWFHVRTIDNAGNAAIGAVHYGPFSIDTQPPIAWFTSQGGQVNVPTITVTWAGGDTLSGVAVYDVQTNTNGAGWSDWLAGTPAQSANFTGLNGQSVSFRVRGHDYANNIGDWSADITVTFGVSVTVNVRDETGIVVLHALVYRNGEYLGMTDSSGNISAPYSMLGDTLSALRQVYVQPAGKPDHLQDGSISWGWRVYNTSINIPNDGTPQLYHITDTNTVQQLAVRKDQALIGVHIIVVVQWDVDEAYLADLRQGLINASSFLYDVTDGQFFYETIEVFDNGQNGPANDMYIYTNNQVWPNAFIGHIEANTGRMMFPPIFGGPWSAKYAYGTMIHEFGHYGLWLYDEYLKRDGSNGGFCTFNRETATEATRASIMDDSDDASEICSKSDPNHLHNSETEQDAQNNGESSWQTVMREYADPQTPSRWTLQSPDTRLVPVVPGPSVIPVPGWIKVYVTDNVTQVCPPFTAMVKYTDGTAAPSAGVWVGASATDPIMEQGLADNKGNIDVRGAHNGDYLYAKKGNASGSIVVSCSPAVQAGQQQSTIPTVVIRDNLNFAWVQYAPLTRDTVEIRMLPSEILPGAPQAQIWQDGAASPITVNLNFDAETGTYYGQATLNPLLDLQGSTQLIAIDGQGNTAYYNVPFMLQQVNSEGYTNLKSGDGQMEVLLPAGSLAGNPIASIQTAIGVKLQQGDLSVIGSPFSVVTSDGAYNLTQPAVMNINFSMPRTSLMATHAAGLYRWDDLSESWILLNSDINWERHFVSARITQLGTYAILAPPIYFINIPIVSK